MHYTFAPFPMGEGQRNWDNTGGKAGCPGKASQGQESVSSDRRAFLQG